MAMYICIAILIVMVGVLSAIVSRILRNTQELDQKYEVVLNEFARITTDIREKTDSRINEGIEKARNEFEKSTKSTSDAIQRIDGAIADINKREIGTADVKEYTRMKNAVLNDFPKKFHSIEKRLKDQKKDPVEYQDGLVGVHIEQNAADEGGKENDLHEG